MGMGTVMNPHMGSVDNLWGFLNLSRNRNEFDEFGICFFITFIFSCIIIAKFLYSQIMCKA